MKRQLRHLLLAVLLFSPGAAFSQQKEPPELLIVVDQSAIATIQQENDYFIRSRLFFAKRHRIVRVNKTVLESDEPFTISLFPDTRITVARDSIRIQPDSLIHWKGKITSPSVPLSTFVNRRMPGMPEEEAIAVWEAIVGLSITGVAYDRDISTNQSYPSKSVRNAQGFIRPDGPSLIEKSAFYAFATTNISLPSNGGTYQIRALPASPEFHTVIEVDKSREFSVESSTDPENEKRRDAYNSYMKSLGEDPRTRWAFRHAESER